MFLDRKKFVSTWFLHCTRADLCGWGIFMRVASTAKQKARHQGQSVKIAFDSFVDGKKSSNVDQIHFQMFGLFIDWGWFSLLYYWYFGP